MTTDQDVVRRTPGNPILLHPPDLSVQGTSEGEEVKKAVMALPGAGGSLLQGLARRM